jgi:hypothetical protein
MLFLPLPGFEELHYTYRPPIANYERFEARVLNACCASACGAERVARGGG